MSGEENVRQGGPPVCKHHQRGYCKNKSKCLQPHNNNICSEKVCRDPYCQERHPKTCKFYARNADCWWKEKCAYQHKKSYNINKIDMLEEEVMNLKKQIKEINKDEDSKKIEVLENSLKVLQQHVNILENELRASRLEVDTSGEISDPTKDVINKENLKCTDCDYHCEKKNQYDKALQHKAPKKLKMLPM